MTRSFYPDGVAIAVDLGTYDEPLISLHFQFRQQGLEDVEMVLTEDEIKVLLGITTEGLYRATVLREMITMFPEQRDAILATLLFRWTGEVGDGSPA